MDQLSILAVTKTADTINRDPNMTEKKGIVYPSFN